MVLIMVLIMVLVVSVAMSVPVVTVTLIVMSVPRNVFLVVPIIPHKVDRSAARVVLRTVLAPVFLMPRSDVQVDRRGRCIFRRSRDHDRLRIDDWRWRNIANVDLTIKAWLAEGDGHAHIPGKCRYGTDT